LSAARSGRVSIESGSALRSREYSTLDLPLS
jgi:hypothetical protein